MLYVKNYYNLWTFVVDMYVEVPLLYEYELSFIVLFFKAEDFIFLLINCMA